MNDEMVLTLKQIESKIFSFRGVQVMVDKDLAELFEIETRVLNQAVKRNGKRFPESFRFQLNDEEFEIWKSQIVMTNNDKMGLRRSPYVFTEQGVAMLSAVLNSDIAIVVSIQIMNAFVKMRGIILEKSLVNHRLEKIELKLLETDQKFEQVFKALESKDTIPTQGVFFDGQVFDAYELASKIIRSAKKSIVLIDNYIDEKSLTHLAKKESGVKVVLLCKSQSQQLLLDVQRANEQYGNFELQSFSLSHDRFLIIDNQEIYHLGASLKDLGRKWFAFSKLAKESVENIMNEIRELIRINS